MNCHNWYHCEMHTYPLCPVIHRQQRVGCCSKSET